MENLFTWPAYPRNEEEFRNLMLAVDLELTNRGLNPSQRSMHISRLFAEAFNWSGNIFPNKKLVELPGFEGQVLMAKAQKWYEDFYANKLNMSLESFPIIIRNNLWEMRIPMVYGEVDMFINRNVKIEKNPNTLNTCNILNLINDFPQAFADDLTKEEIFNIVLKFDLAFKALKWQKDLPDLVSPKDNLFSIAKADYESSTSLILRLNKSSYGLSMWASQQAVEKTLKGLLSLGNFAFPTTNNGHNFTTLQSLIKNNINVDIPTILLDKMNYKPKVRYEETQHKQDLALTANQGVLELFKFLAEDKDMKLYLSQFSKKTIPAIIKYI